MKCFCAGAAHWVNTCPGFLIRRALHWRRWKTGTNGGVRTGCCIHGRRGFFWGKQEGVPSERCLGLGGSVWSCCTRMPRSKRTRSLGVGAWGKVICQSRGYLNGSTTCRRWSMLGWLGGSGIGKESWKKSSYQPPFCWKSGLLRRCFGSTRFIKKNMSPSNSWIC